MVSNMNLRLLACAALFFAGAAARSQDAEDPDAAYVAKFLERNRKVDPVPSLEVYANPARYAALYLGENLDRTIVEVNNDKGGIAWGLSYRMMSLNDMYRVTKDPKYLDAHRRCIEAVLAATDDKRGKALWTGRVVPAWGCDIYAERGRAVFAVHTGIITAPMYEFLRLANGNPEYRAGLGEAFQAILAGANAALAVHDRQWRDGPGEQEGRYIGLDQENVCENKPLPGNRLSAMGWALWESWKVSGNTVHRDRAIALGRYFKNRVTRAPDGAYYWPYWLPETPVTETQPKEQISGEDSSHAGLTMSLVFALWEDGEVFTAEDMSRFARTVLNGLARRTDGILISRINGTTELEPSYLGAPSQWLPLAAIDSEVHSRILPYYLSYRATPSPLELAQLLRYAGAKE